MALACLGTPATALGAVIEVSGLSFSDERGGFQLVQGWGRGTQEDPIVLVEEVTGTGPVVLTVRGLTPDFGNRATTHHTAGFVLLKVVRNLTLQTWSFYTLELRQHVDYMSPDADGLSFGQGSEAITQFSSNSYRRTRAWTDPFDGVQFSDGLVQPGETAEFRIVVTDSTPRKLFYLVQVPESHLAQGPGPPGAAGVERQNAASSQTVEAGLAARNAESALDRGLVRGLDLGHHVRFGGRVGQAVDAALAIDQLQTVGDP